MKSGRLAFVTLLVCSACSKAGSPGSGGGGGGGGGTYAAVNGDPIAFEFKSGGTVVMNGGPMGSSTGTYTVDGEKLVVTMPGSPTYTFIKDGNCIADQLQMFGKLCIGGKDGEASNVTTRSVPTTPSGTWVATNADGEFRLEFKSANTLTLTLTAPGSAPASKSGTFIVEGDMVHVTLDQSEPMVLKFVNNAYESTAFGLPMRFVKQ